MTTNSAKTADPIVTAAIHRIAATRFPNSRNGEVAAYECAMTLPKQFKEDAAKANQLFKRIQADFCKSVLRGTGTTPRYVAIRANNEKCPEFRFALFTPANAPLDNPEEYSEHGRAIANHKASQMGWTCENMDIVEILLDSCTFKIAHEPLRIHDAGTLKSLEEHLGDKADSVNGQRSVFVSKAS